MVYVRDVRIPQGNVLGNATFAFVQVFHLFKAPKICTVLLPARDTFLYKLN